MASKKLLWILNTLVCVEVLLHAYGLFGGSSRSLSGDASYTGGNVDSVISVGDSPTTVYRNEVISRAENRGYYTTSEYATVEGVEQKTIYRRLDSGSIPNAEKVNGRWRIFCN